MHRFWTKLRNYKRTKIVMISKLMASLSLVSLNEKLLWVNTCHSWVYACTPCVFKVCCKYHLLCLEESVRTRFLYISHYKRLVVLVQQTSKQPSNQITSHPLWAAILSTSSCVCVMYDTPIAPIGRVGTSCTSYGNFENASDSLGFSKLQWLFVSIF